MCISRFENVTLQRFEKPLIMKKFLNILFSTRTMAVLLLVYAIAMAVATFVENEYDTATAKALIYNAKWFELVMLLLILNFIGNISRYKLWRREKWPILAFHLAFVFLFVGGAITRYISFEGVMLLREGESNNQIISAKRYVKVRIEDKGDVFDYKKAPYIMSPLHYDFKGVYKFRDEEFKIEGVDYILRKMDSLAPDANGKEYLHLVSTQNGSRENIYIQPGGVKDVNGTLVSFNRPIDGAVQIFNDKGFLQIKSPSDAKYMTMATMDTGSVAKEVLDTLRLRSLYTIDNLQLVVPQGVQKGHLVEYSGDKNKNANVPDLLRVKVTGPKSEKIVEIETSRSDPSAYTQLEIDGKHLLIGYGPKLLTLPFSLKLDDFVMETYPGSNSPSAYESHIQIVENGKETPYKIYMNHVLDHEGYRFFQAGFDPDQRGSHLSVNHDFWGTNITYIGYTILFISMFITLFWKGTRFWQLNKMLKTLSRKKLMMLAFALLTMGGIHAQTYDGSGTKAKTEQGSGKIDMHGDETYGKTQVQETSPTAKDFKNSMIISPEQIVKMAYVDKAHADKFGYALVQDIEGRIVPVNTLALQVLRKIYKKDSFHGMDANQWFLSINTHPFIWTQVPIIKVSKDVGEDFLKKAHVNKEGYTTLVSLFPLDANGQPRFIFEDDYEEAFRKSPARQTRFDNAVIKLNDQLQAFNGILSGQYMRMIPVPNDVNHRWNSWLDANLEPDEASQKILGPYFASVLDATKNGNWAKADRELEKLQAYQHKWGAKVIPSDTKIKVEVMMNQLNLNLRLLMLYSVIGGLLLVLGFINLFRQSKVLKVVINVIIWIGILGYIIHFLGLVGRWYVSGHAPWSNGYEAIMFISWVGITAGLILYRNSNALIPSAGFLVAVIMMGFAYGGAQLNPQITPLEPVLKSYWLIVHVAIITSSYGFFALSMIIAIICLFFYILANVKTFKKHNDKTIKELSIVSEMSLTIGLFALTVGNFLGGVWANESWGRYWSWDPKETWAFISIIVYAFVLHMRLVPGLRGRWTYHTVTLFAFSSMVMTYFGVNYYLSGLHSYAAGEPLPIPSWVYISLAFMVSLSAVSYFRYKVLHKKAKRFKEERTETEP